MGTVILTTTLSELNRLFGRYYEEVDKKPPHSQEAENAWIEYATYASRYNKERGLPIESVAACSWVPRAVAIAQMAGCTTGRSFPENGRERHPKSLRVPSDVTN